MSEATLFHEALTKPAAERAAFLDAACAGQPELRAAVVALLAEHEAPGSLQDRPPFEPEPTAASGPGQPRDTATADATPEPDGACATATRTAEYQPQGAPGVVIAGRYTLQQKIGEGGMGEVWVAKQTDPVKRRVALKLIKTGMDSRSVLQRFEQERQALAMMDHPNIAMVLDGGLTPTGQPFFVMELVNGLPLTTFCDEARLSTRERLELFVPICQAVQHAHQKGIVHRDLKPANILITIIDGKPVPKVIDFGVAKATAGRLTDESMSTQFGAVVGTLEYMSPEQAGFWGIDIDTRADIYSLGVILYELLTGLRPIDARRLKKAALTEMIRIIREEEPPKPSTRLSTDESAPSMAALRQIEPRKLMALLRGELDWVVMKCLEKDRERRYETANGLAKEIQRYLADEPVEARPPSAGYLLGKFLHRNRGPVLAAAMVLLAVVGGLAAVLGVQSIANARLQQSNGETRLALIETQKAQTATAAALDESEESRKQAEAVGTFLVEAFEKPDPSTEGKDVKVAEILDQATAGLSKGFAGSKATEGALLDALGKAYYGLGLYSKAEETHRKARTVREAALGPSHRDALASASRQAWAVWYAGRQGEGGTMLEEVVARQKAALGPDDPDTLESRGSLYWFYASSGRAAEAIPLLQATLAASEARLGVDHKGTLSTRENLAEAYRLAGRHVEAIAWHESTRKLRESKLGPDHPDTLTSRTNLALAYQAAGRTAEAIAMHEATWKLRESKLGPDHPNTLISRTSLAQAYYDAGQPAEAIAMDEATLKLYESKLGPDHPGTLATRNNLAAAYVAAGRSADAIALHASTLKLYESKLGPDHPNTLASRNNLANAYLGAGRNVDAVALHASTLKLYESKLGPDHPSTLASRNNLAKAYLGAGRTADAVALLESTLKLFESKLGPDHPNTNFIRNNLATGHERLGRWAVAEALYRDNLAHRRKTEKPTSPLLAGDLANLGRSLLKQSKWSEAEPLLRECLAMRIKAIPDDWRRSDTESLLGGVLLGQGRHAEAEPLVIGGYEGMKAREAKIVANLRLLVTEAGERVVRLYEAWQKPEQAAAWATKLGLAELPKDVPAK